MTTDAQRQREYLQTEFRRYFPDASMIHADNYTEEEVIEVRVWFDQSQFVYHMEIGSNDDLYRFTDDDGKVITVPPMRRRVLRVSTDEFIEEIMVRATPAQKAKLEEMGKFGWRPFQIGDGNKGYTIWCACDARVTGEGPPQRAYITPDGIMTRYEPKRR